jgi:hypothetical protein
MRLMRTNQVYLGFALILTFGCAQAAGIKKEILNDRQMAAIKGGFCLVETCETGVPTGKCQVIPANFAGVCPKGTCRFWVIDSGFGEVDVCTLFGHYTCTGTGGYRKCITGKLWDICTYSSVNVCGDIYEPFCTENIQEHTCTCNARLTGDPCDWTNCVP